MPMTKTKPTVTTRATESAKAKTEDDARVIERVAQALEAAQEDLRRSEGALEPARAICARTCSGCCATRGVT